MEEILYVVCIGSTVREDIWFGVVDWVDFRYYSSLELEKIVVHSFALQEPSATYVSGMKSFSNIQKTTARLRCL